MVLFIDQLRNKNKIRDTQASHQWQVDFSQSQLVCLCSCENANCSMMGPARKTHRSTTEDHIMRTLDARCRVSATGCSRDVDEKEEVKKSGFGCLEEITLTKKIDYFSFVLLNTLYLFYNLFHLM